MLRTSRFLLCCSLLAGVGWHAPTAAQEMPVGYPSRPIRLIVSSVAGGAMDIMCRSVGQMLNERWGQPVIVDNRSGGATVLATELAAKAAPDGYTLFGGSDNLRIIGVTKRVPFDVRKAFEPVVPMATQPYILLVIPALPVKSFKELVAYSMTQPVTYGSSGVGTTAHLGLESLFAQTGGKFVHVPYKGGAQSLLALMSGEIHMYPGLLLSANTAIKQGKARAIVALSLNRIPALPDLPTLAEQGFPGFKITNSYSLYAPAGTPRSIIGTMNRLVGDFINSPQMAQKLTAEGSQPAERMTPEELKAVFAREYEEVERQVKQLKVKLY
ncbi:MAG: putative tricarboxylic transport rane protein [Betaproteobacteria bacterium]|nr:putative tricarboxylic transport rane protein [Betaproteobacteria bacterium]